ncbi:bifunctional 2-polyprenyl-6-hydroxyphenol methylase/3-demethylubiquinol 3-O-methyltransferase UbiG [Rickettsiales endosymbiont of Peranema trichophorum]|uniref:bifunctional 2-polyprenyl-6-hydroxyphenol methylase/3-demethylubiquinol 3-O-methyltransferase UbiG n=1 Tax=Rickettsiales endosymbiont of Peranema trichophorum TaxID=2486577 RepID=UPI001022F606|nr:bifunctional 2-polyprenyl-6-hydroxyphenol methylase/3-demethylubiquinol 3-O-methyltransferase UbiG [Rickettsiales endosymbiont of Peranema trichophorum]RZI47667.1 bifunctional 2-polyprenyl-6-hydroxyphenol methylase/3-demethylubiquinol 3-O-methyltransferase UbiG [Rickettsiales endosymbiont of Peranema trichophorum]
MLKFSQLSSEWWNEEGSFKALHQLNPLRIDYILDKIDSHIISSSHSTKNSTKTRRDVKCIDIGCGGGVLSIPLAKVGLQVLGVDPGSANIDAAYQYLDASQLQHLLNENLSFEVATAEQLLTKERYKHSFDVVIAMEVIEHVMDPKEFIRACMDLLKPNGLLFVSTLNRTLKSYIYGIIGAEYILRVVPRGTHAWDKFVKPSELQKFGQNAGGSVMDVTGIKLNPFTGIASTCNTHDMNYIMCLVADHQPKSTA